MTPPPRATRRALLAALAAAWARPAAWAAEAWPARPLNLVIGAPPGGSLDLLARQVAIPLADALGKPVLVLNRPGGGQVVAARAVAGASDGHTVLIGTEALALNVRLHPDQPDPRKDLVPVSLMTRSSLCIAAAPDSPYRSFAEFVAEARRRPGEIAYGSAGGTATVSNLIMVALQAQLGIQLIHVPYGSGPQAVQATMARQTGLAAGTSFLVRPQAEAGRLLPLAVTSAEREPAMKTVPTLAELGLPGLTTYAWWGFLAPRSMPPAVLARLHDLVAAALASQPIRDALIPQGMEIVASTPEAFGAFFDAEVLRWGEIIDRNQVRAGE